MILPKLTDIGFKDKTVLVRSDLDVPLKNGRVEDDTRIKECLPTIKYLLDQGAKVILLGHLDRPGGKIVDEFRMLIVAEEINKKLNIKNQIYREKIKNFEAYRLTPNLTLLENLRFYAGEENNNIEFARNLSSLGDFYVNDAFATSHREHASIVGLPKFLSHFAGLHFIDEVEGLSKAIENPKRPLVYLLGGKKLETKLPYIESFSRRADIVLVGGKLIQSPKIKNQNGEFGDKIIWAKLTESGLDISEEFIKEFSKIINEAGTIVWNGPMGKFEDKKSEMGTRKIAEAIAKSLAFKIIGGGDTIAALRKFNLFDKMDYVSTAGGAMLEFLAKGTLPGIEALMKRND